MEIDKDKETYKDMDIDRDTERDRDIEIDEALNTIDMKKNEDDTLT